MPKLKKSFKKQSLTQNPINQVATLFPTVKLSNHLLGRMNAFINARNLSDLNTVFSRLMEDLQHHPELSCDAQAMQFASKKISGELGYRKVIFDLFILLHPKEEGFQELLATFIEQLTFRTKKNLSQEEAKFLHYLLHDKPCDLSKLDEDGKPLPFVKSLIFGNGLKTNWNVIFFLYLHLLHVSELPLSPQKNLVTCSQLLVLLTQISLSNWKWHSISQLDSIFLTFINLLDYQDKSQSPLATELTEIVLENIQDASLNLAYLAWRTAPDFFWQHICPLFKKNRRAFEGEFFEQYYEDFLLYTLNKKGTFASIKNQFLIHFKQYDKKLFRSQDINAKEMNGYLHAIYKQTMNDLGVGEKEAKNVVDSNDVESFINHFNKNPSIKSLDLIYYLITILNLLELQFRSDVALEDINFQLNDFAFKKNETHLNPQTWLDVQYAKLQKHTLHFTIEKLTKPNLLLHHLFLKRAVLKGASAQRTEYSEVNSMASCSLVIRIIDRYCHRRQKNFPKFNNFRYSCVKETAQAKEAKNKRAELAQQQLLAQLDREEKEKQIKSKKAQKAKQQKKKKQQRAIAPTPTIKIAQEPKKPRAPKTMQSCTIKEPSEEDFRQSLRGQVLNGLTVLRQNLNNDVLAWSQASLTIRCELKQFSESYDEEFLKNKSLQALQTLYRELHQKQTLPAMKAVDNLIACLGVHVLRALKLSVGGEFVDDLILGKQPHSIHYQSSLTIKQIKGNVLTTLKQRGFKVHLEAKENVLRIVFPKRYAHVQKDELIISLRSNNQNRQKESLNTLRFDLLEYYQTKRVRLLHFQDDFFHILDKIESQALLISKLRALKKNIDADLLPWIHADQSIKRLLINLYEKGEWIIAEKPLQDLQMLSENIEKKRPCQALHQLDALIECFGTDFINLLDVSIHGGWLRDVIIGKVPNDLDGMSLMTANEFECSNAAEMLERRSIHWQFNRKKTILHLTFPKAYEHIQTEPFTICLGNNKPDEHCINLLKFNLSTYHKTKKIRLTGSYSDLFAILTNPMRFSNEKALPICYRNDPMLILRTIYTQLRVGWPLKNTQETKDLFCQTINANIKEVHQWKASSPGVAAGRILKILQEDQTFFLELLQKTRLINLLFPTIITNDSTKAFLDAFFTKILNAELASEQCLAQILAAMALISKPPQAATSLTFFSRPWDPFKEMAIKPQQTFFSTEAFLHDIFQQAKELFSQSIQQLKSDNSTSFDILAQCYYDCKLTNSSSDQALISNRIT